MFTKACNTAIIVLIAEFYRLLLFATGLARKEDFPYITYYCPHCHTLNQPKQSEDRVSGFNSPTSGNLIAGGYAEAINKTSNSTSGSSSPIRACSENEEVIERPTSGELVS